ncbi:MAG: sugar phosphate isomerase/epimerase [Clostridia bacterium]|nr:sugar phosphate isomerase/epimerase [Clostridia bacterium]
MKQYVLQLYTIRDFMKNEEDFAASMKKIAAMGYKDLHTAGCAIDEKRYIEMIKENGMSICGTHYNYDKIVEDVEGTIKLHRLWETDNIGIGGMPGFAHESLENLKKFIAKYNEMAKIYASEGFKLTYHNHAFEFHRVDGTKTVMDYLYEGFDPENVSFVLDTCWVQAGGGDVRHWIEKLQGRIDILHLKDCMRVLYPEDRQGLTMTEVGNGNIWMEGVIDTARKCGVKYYVVEQDANWLGGDPFASAQASADYLKKFI